MGGKKVLYRSERPVWYEKTHWLWKRLLTAVASTAGHELMLKVRHKAAPKLVWFLGSWAKRWEKRGPGEVKTSSATTLVVKKSSKNGSAVLAVQLYNTNPRATLPAHFTNAVQELVSVSRLERGPLDSDLHTNRSDEVHQPWRKRKENSFGIGWSLHAAIKTSVAAFGEETDVKIRCVKEPQQRRHRLFRKEDVAEENLFLGPSGGFTRGGDPSPSGVHQ